MTDLEDLNRDVIEEYEVVEGCSLEEQELTEAENRALLPDAAKWGLTDIQKRTDVT